MKPSRQSDQERFRDLYADTRGDLLAFVTRRAPTPEDAADILAETYLIAWHRLDAVPGGETGRLWLFGVARNLLLKAGRQTRVRDALSQRLAIQLRASATARDAQPDDPRLGRLRDALNQLSEHDREILTLAAWEQLTPREIAAVTNTSANTVRVRLHRARKRLGQQLAQPSPASAPFAPFTSHDRVGR